jgi:hypothetical protein
MSDDTRERSRDAARDASAPPNGSDRNQTMLQPDGHLDAEMVSAWLDTPEDFSAADALVIEEHLATCAECRQIAAHLTAIVRAFQTLPLVETSRSYGLTPEMAGLTRTPTLPASRLEEPANLHERTVERDSRRPAPSYELVAWHERWMGRLRLATTVAAILFVFAFSADLLGNIDTAGDDDDDAAMVTDQPNTTSGGAEESAAGAAPAEATEAAASMPEEESEQDSVRLADETPNPAGAAEEEEDTGELATSETTGGGSSAQPEPTPAGAEEEAEEAPPAQGGDEPTMDDAETMLTVETAVPEQDEFVQQEDQTTSAYSAEQATGDGESNVLHMLELALIIIIAWLLVAMIALPRLRRTGT